MEPAVLVALLTAAASLVVAVATGVMTQRREARLKTLEHQFRLDESATERQAEAEAVLERYRGPLLAAAFDLQDRLDNLIDPERDFLAGYGGRRDPRRDDALKTTLYRVAQYLCWVEIMRRDRLFLTFREPEDTRAVSDLLAGIGSTFADDRYGQEFMLWREEQRAIGERMIDGEGCAGYATFVERYPAAYERWLGRFEQTIDRKTAMESERLGDLREALRSLVEALDPDELRYRRFWEGSE